MPRKLLALVVCVLATAVSGCVSRSADFTLLSTKNVEVSRVDLKRIDFRRNIEATDARWWFLFIPLGGAPDLQEATDRCLEVGQGDFMTSARIYESVWSLLLVSRGSISVKGDVGNSLSPGAGNLPDR